MHLFTENMKWSFGLWKNKDLVNNKTDGPVLLTEALCLHGNKGRELRCISADLFALGKTANLPPTPQPTGLFHASSNLSHTDWYTVEYPQASFSLKKPYKSPKAQKTHKPWRDRRITSYAQNNNRLHRPTLLPTLPYSLCSINEWENKLSKQK